MVIPTSLRSLPLSLSLLYRALHAILTSQCIRIANNAQIIAREADPNTMPRPGTRNHPILRVRVPDADILAREPQRQRGALAGRQRVRLGEVAQLDHGRVEAAVVRRRGELEVRLRHGFSGRRGRSGVGHLHGHRVRGFPEGRVAAARAAGRGARRCLRARVARRVRVFLGPCGPDGVRRVCFELVEPRVQVSPDAGEAGRVVRVCGGG